MTDSEFVPYAPGNRTVDVIQRIRDGRTGAALTITQLQTLGVPVGNADRVQRALVFLGLINPPPDYDITASAKALRKANDTEYPQLLGDIIQKAYAGVFEIVDLKNVTRNDLVNAFRRYDPAGQRDNMISLFVALCRECAIMAPEAEPRRTPTTKKTTAGARTSPQPATKKRFTDSGGFLHPVLDVMLADIKQKVIAGKWTKRERDAFLKIFPINLDTYLPVTEIEEDPDNA